MAWRLGGRGAGGLRQATCDAANSRTVPAAWRGSSGAALRRRNSAGATLLARLARRGNRAGAFAAVARRAPVPLDRDCLIGNRVTASRIDYHDANERQVFGFALKMRRAWWIRLTYLSHPRSGKFRTGRRAPTSLPRDQRRQFPQGNLQMHPLPNFGLLDREELTSLSALH